MGALRKAGVWLGLVEEEVCGQLLILVACKIGLDNEIPLKAKATQALNSKGS